MTLSFVIPELNIGGAGTPPLEFYSRGFNLGGSGSSPTWRDVILSGNTALTLVNAKANELNYLTLYGGTEQSGTPTPSSPVDIVCNNGVIKYGQYGKNLFDANLTLSTGYINSSGAIVSGSSLKVSPFIEIKPNTTYTLSGVGDVKSLTYDRYAYTYTEEQTPIAQVPSQTGGASTTFTTAQNAKYIRIQMTTDAVNTCQLELGTTATPYEPYKFGVHVDGTVETVEVHSQNIFNKNDTDDVGGWYAGSGNTISSANANETMVMRAKPNTTYYFKHCSVKGGCRAFYTEVENWEIGSACSAMSGNAGANANAVYSITTSANAKWIFFNYSRNNLEASLDDQRNDFMVSLTELTSSTTYESYYYGGSATAEMLLKVGDYQDVQEVLTGDVTRNIGIKIFDGSENFGTSNATFTYAVNDRVTAKTPLICSHFEYSTKTSSQVEDLKIISFSSTNIGFRYDACADKTAFGNWLKSQYDNGTPVIVVYPLATATTSSVTPQSLNIQAGTNVVEITQASISNLPLEVSYKGTV